MRIVRSKLFLMSFARVGILVLAGSIVIDLLRGEVHEEMWLHAFVSALLFGLAGAFGISMREERDRRRKRFGVRWTQ
jgi:hypothetical protein